jgi:tetraacyldisaccharide 4'-kinase
LAVSSVIADYYLLFVSVYLGYPLLAQFFKLCASGLWRCGYLLDRRLRLAPPKNIQFKTPLLGVGCFLSGGAGKTPVVRRLANYYSGLGLRVGVLCYPTGDEDRWLEQQCGVPIFRGRSRLRLCSELDGRFDLLLSDDGLEDRRLAHALWLRLDWGERAERIADLVPHGGCRSLGSDHPEVRWTVRCAMEDAPEASSADLVFATTMPRNALGEAPKGPVVALGGIFPPERFFRGLARLGLDVAQCVARPDHDRNFSAAVMRLRSRGLAVAITEKDAVRLGGQLRADPLVYVAGLELRCDVLPYADLTKALRLGTF